MLRGSYLALSGPRSRVPSCLPASVICRRPTHCETWASVTDWTHLRHLDARTLSAHYLFVALTGRAVNLESLKFLIRGTTWDLRPEGAGPPILATFIASINALREVELDASRIKELETALAVVLGNVRGSLVRLVIRCISHGTPSWSPEQYIEVLRQAPGLAYLNARIAEDKVEGSWVGTERERGSQEKYASARRELKGEVQQS